MTTLPRLSHAIAAAGLVAGLWLPQDALRAAPKGVPMGAVIGTVYVDLDNDTTRDAGEDGIAGVALDLLTSGGVTIASTTTDSSGQYAFSGLVADDYTVVQTQPLGYASTTPDTVAVVVPFGVSVTGIDFGEKAGSLTGVVYVDSDGNGVRDAGEAGLAGVAVELSGLDALSAVITRTLTTAADGRFESGPLLSGTYRLSQPTQPVAPTVPPQAFPDGAETIGDAGGSASGSDTIDGIVLAVGSDASGYAFGELRLPQVIDVGAAPASVAFTPGGTFAVPLTGGGSGLPVTIASTTPATCSISGSTASVLAVGACSLQADQAGNSLFAPAPQATLVVTITQGVQTIGFAPLADRRLGEAPVTLAATASSGLAVVFASLTPGTCSVSGTQATALATGTCTIRATQAGDATWQAAPAVERSFEVLPGPGISGRVFIDGNNNTTLDSGEGGLAGIVLSLRDGDNVIVASTATDGSGGYTFSNLAPGSYTVLQTQPVGYASTTPDTVAVVVASGVSVTGIDFGEKAGSLAGVVYVDSDGNGVRDAGEVGLSGVSIELTGIDATKAPVARTLTTAADGRFESGPLLSGTYRLSQPVQPVAPTVPPQAFPDGTETIGDAGGSASGSDTIDGVMLAAGSDASGYAFGELRLPQAIDAAAAPTSVAFTPGGTFAVPLTGGGSGLPVTIASTTPAICSISGSTASVLAVGACVLQADQAGNAVFAPAPPAQLTIAITAGGQTISFAPLADRRLGEAPVALAATASSGLAVAFASITPAACSVSGNLVTSLATGTCTVRATQPGDATWQAAAPVERSFQVLPALAPPGAPQAPRASASGSTVVVSWTAPQSDGGSPVTAYTVIAQPGGATCVASGAPAPLSCTFRSLPAGNYVFQISASNAIGNGPPAEVMGSVVLPPPQVVPVLSPLGLLLLVLMSLAGGWWHRRRGAG